MESQGFLSPHSSSLLAYRQNNKPEVKTPNSVGRPRSESKGKAKNSNSSLGVPHSIHIENVSGQASGPTPAPPNADVEMGDASGLRSFE